MHAVEVCEDPQLRLAINLAFACTLRDTSSSGDEAAMIAKLLSNPETANLLKALVKAMDGNNG